ncbi:MAG: glycosyltransferase family 4 protein, partial [bacterium]
MNWINFPQSGTFILFFMADSISYWYWFFLIQGFVITLMSVPVITTFARKYQLVYVPNQRSSHTIPVPALGGIAIYAGFMISFLLLRYVGYMESLKVSLVILSIFIIGLVDDLVDLKASLKLFVFIILATVIAFSQGLSVTNLHGFLGITHMNGIFSYIITIFGILAILNAINLIDGVDGLAGGLGIFILSVLSWVFFKSNHIDYLILTLPMILALLAFLIFNVWGKNYKIFMGDSGS